MSGGLTSSSLVMIGIIDAVDTARSGIGLHNIYCANHDQLWVRNTAGKGLPEIVPTIAGKVEALQASYDVAEDRRTGGRLRC